MTTSPLVLVACCCTLFGLVSCGGEPKGKPVEHDAGKVKTLTKKGVGTDSDVAPDGETETDVGTAAPGTGTPVSREEMRVRAVVAQLTKRIRAAEDSDERAEVLSLVVDLGPSAAGMKPEVVAALKDEEPMTRGFAVSALAAIDPQNCRLQLEAALKDSEGEVRSKAAEAWGAVGIVDLMPLLDQANDEIDEKVQHAIMLVVEKKGQEFLVPKVVSTLGALDATAAKAALRFLTTHLGTGKEHAAQVAEVLTRRDADLRRQAAETLEAFGVKSFAVVEGLIQALDDDEKPVRQAVNKALVGLTGHRTSYLSSHEGEERAAGIKAWRDWLSANKGALGS